MNNKLIVGLLIVVAGLGLGWYMLKGGYTTNNTASTEATVTPSLLTTGTTLETTPFPSSTGSETGTDKGGVPTDGKPNSEGKGVFVTYTDSGYTPNTLTVKKGTLVTFVNQSGKGMWTASAVHPTHQLLPGFDELKEVAKGGLYEYTFVKVGTWKYHNHVSPSDLGTVIVTE